MSSREEVPTFGKQSPAAPINHLTALAELTGTLTSILDPSAVIQATISELGKVLAYYGAVVWMKDPETSELYVAASSGITETDKLVRVKPGIGLLGTAMSTGHALLIPDTLEDPRFVQQIASNLIRNILLAPIVIDGTPAGVISVGSQTPHTYSGDEFQLLVACANATSIALKNAQLYAAQREEMEIRDALLTFAEEIRGLSILKDLLSRIAEFTPRLVGMDQCLIFLTDQKTGEVSLEQTYGFTGESLKVLTGLHFDSEESIELQRALSKINVPYITDCAHDCPIQIPELRKFFEGFTIAVLPLIRKGVPLGFIILGKLLDHRTYGSRERVVLRGIADQVAVAIENAQLYQEATKRRIESQEIAARLRAVLLSMAEGVIVYDKDMNAVVTNPAVARIFRVPNGYVARNKNMIQVLKETANRLVDADSALKDLEVILAAPEQPYEMEWTLRDPTVVLKRVWSPVYDNQGGFLGGVAVFHNITAEREAQNARDEFLSVVSHEVRNPLSLIKGLAQTMLRRRRNETPTREHEELQVIVEQANRISRLVNDLLDVARIERRVLSLELRPVHLPTLLADLRKKLATDLNQHSLSLNVPENFPEGQWDKDRLVQALTNLIENAAKYTPAGGSIVVSCERVGEEAVVCVADDGIGIPEQYLHRVFDRFFKVQQTSNTGTGGNIGLGLYITKSLIDAHGGRIWVESQAGKGSKFYFSLPFCKQDQNHSS